jgi:hypothetical protein
MSRYLVLYNSPVSAAELMASSTPEQMEAGMDAWTAWASKAGDAVIDLGTPLDSGTHLEPDSSGPGSSQATGYSIIQADSLDAATKLLEDHPHFQTPGGSIDVLECMSVPGM